MNRHNPFEGIPNAVFNAPGDIDLTASPTTLFLFEKDSAAIEVLMRTGALPFVPQPEVKDHGTLAFVIFVDHPTHWIIGGRFRGYAHGHQNGWIAIADPKAITPSEKEASARLKNVLGEGEMAQVRTVRTGRTAKNITRN